MQGIKFPAAQSPPPATLPVRVAGYFRDAGVSAVCHPVAEGTMMAAACLFFEKTGGLFPGEGRILGKLMASAYGRMALSPS